MACFFLPNWFSKTPAHVCNSGDILFLLQFDEDELYSNFKDFYKDVLEEFRSVGQVQQFKVILIVIVIYFIPMIFKEPLTLKKLNKLMSTFSLADPKWISSPEKLSLLLVHFVYERGVLVSSVRLLRRNSQEGNKFSSLKHENDLEKVYQDTSFNHINSHYFVLVVQEQLYQFKLLKARFALLVYRRY